MQRKRVVLVKKGRSPFAWGCGVTLGILFALILVFVILPLAGLGGCAAVAIGIGLMAPEAEEQAAQEPLPFVTDELSEREKAILRKAISEREREPGPQVRRETQPGTSSVPEPDDEMKQRTPQEPPTPKTIPKGHGVIAAEDIAGVMTITVVIRGKYTRDEVLELARNIKKSYASQENTVEIGFYESPEAAQSNKLLGRYRCRDIAETLDWGGK